MTDNQKKLVELDKKKEEIRAYYDELTETIKALSDEMGVDGMFQDEESGIVYQIVKPEGTFIQYKEIDYIRTKREGERSGALSIKKAKEKGFKVKE